MFILRLINWLVVWTPLKNDGVRQLGLLFPVYGEKMLQTTNQLSNTFPY